MKLKTLKYVCFILHHNEAFIKSAAYVQIQKIMNNVVSALKY